MSEVDKKPFGKYIVYLDLDPCTLTKMSARELSGNLYC